MKLCSLVMYIPTSPHLFFTCIIKPMQNRSLHIASHGDLVGQKLPRPLCSNAHKCGPECTDLKYLSAKHIKIFGHWKVPVTVSLTHIQQPKIGKLDHHENLALCILILLRCLWNIHSIMQRDLRGDRHTMRCRVSNAQHVID